MVGNEDAGTTRATTAGTAGTDLATYPIGETDAQTRRLITQAQLYAPSTRNLFSAAGIGRGMKVLDVGSGVGDVALLLADLVGPGGQVVGVEMNAAAVETARARVGAAGWRNVRFLSGTIDNVALDADFDAVAGRFVLMWVPNPVAVLRRVKAYLRPGGIVAFQDNDFTYSFGASPAIPELDHWAPLLAATQQAPGGPDFHLGLKLLRLYLEAGLAAPNLTLDAPIGGGPAWAGYDHIAETIGMLAPLLPQMGSLDSGEIDVAALAARLRREAVERSALIMLPAVVGAWARL
jgi:SAM-dependent methyltransferase